MAQAIMILKNTSLDDLISLQLNSVLGIEIISMPDISKTLELLKILPDIEFVVLEGDDNLKDLILLAEFIKEKKLDTHIFMFGETQDIYKKYEKFLFTIENNQDWKNILKKVSLILGIDEATIKLMPKPQFKPIKAIRFFNLDSCCCDVYIRIKKEQEYQFVKRIHQGDHFSREDIQKYIDQGLINFYISSDSADHFFTFLSNILIEKLEAFNGPEADLVDLLGDSFNVITDDLKKDFNLNRASIQLSEEIINKMLKTIQNTTNVNVLLRKVLNGTKASILFQKCFMTTIVGHSVLKTLDVTDKFFFEQITKASFFHDLAFIDNEELSLIHSID